MIVVGAGLAGAAAALRLGKADRRVLILEGRERVGGRAYARPFQGADEAQDLEFGGAWITPWHDRLRALVAEHGLALRSRHPVTARFWFWNGALHAAPVSEPERAAHERILARVAADAILLKKGHGEDEKGRPLRGISFAEYLDRLDAPAATRGLFSAWWTVSGNGDHGRVVASEFLSSCAYGDGLAEGMIDCWADTVTPGMGVLASRMIEASGATLALSATVTDVVQDAGGVRVAMEDGREHSAPFAILALGVNQLHGIRFKPPIPPALAAAIGRGHDGRAFKLWALVEGVAPGTLVTGDGRGIEFAFAERRSGSATLLVCFGLTGPDARPDDPEWVRSEIGRLFPNTRFLSHDWHDWVGDRHARGTWVAAPVGGESGLDPENWRPQGRLAFATSDVARDQAGWFEGAVIAGEDAADAALAGLAG